MIFLIFPLVIISFVFIFYQLKYAAFIRTGNRFPGPPNWPFLGNAQYFINTPVERNLEILGEFFVNYGNTYRVWIGKELNVFFQNSEDLKVIMSGNKFINKGSPYDVMRPWLNEGLLVSQGKKWFTRRKIITPAFHFTSLEQYTKIFEKQGQILCDVLKNLMKQGSFELYQPVNRYTMDVISVPMQLLIKVFLKAVTICSLNFVCHFKSYKCTTKIIFRFASRGHMTWPPKSNNLTKLANYLLGYVRALVYAEAIDVLEENIRGVITEKNVLENYKIGFSK